MTPRSPLAAQRFRWLTILLWVALAAGLVLLIPSPGETSPEHASFLPDETPYRIASDSLAERFPAQAGLSQATIVFERSEGPLTGEDRAFINRIALAISQPFRGDLTKDQLRGVRVTAPGAIDLTFAAAKGSDLLHNPAGKALELLNGRWKRTPDLPNPLRSQVSDAGQASIIRVNIPANFVTHRAARVTGHIRDLLAETPRPEGLDVAVTGTAGYGFDYVRFVERSHQRTIITTLIAVVVILLVVYRAPLAALVPLLAIGAAAVLADKAMDLAQHQGLAIGLAERIFVFVLMFGAGIDYSLLLISRFRERIEAGLDDRPAVAEALRATFPAIAASAGTDAAGIFMLIFTRFLIFRTTGPTVAGALIIAMLAAVTLVPALLAILGRRVYWPRIPRPTGEGTPHAEPVRRDRAWRAIAALVTRRPGLVLVLTGLLLVIPATRAPNIQWVYDALAGDPVEVHRGVGNAVAGIEMAKRHWPIGEIAPVAVLVETDTPQRPDRMARLSRNLTRRSASLPGVKEVRSYTQPLGANVSLPGNTPVQKMVRSFASNQYVGPRNQSLRMEVVLDVHALSNEAMAQLAELRRCLRNSIDQADLPATVHLAGSTAQMAEIRNVTQRDFRLVFVLVLGVVFLVVLVLLRDLGLTVFMLGSVVLSYLATLGLCDLVAGPLLGASGLDWKVQSFLFVVMAAVGVDYNIFLVARLAQESRRHPPVEAIRQAVIHTGPVISSCGLIMAATLGSLMVGDVQLLRQLGFAMSLGMLIDTFITRPLLLPSFATLA
jgi:putative drug exporter of the RND superfamily